MKDPPMRICLPDSPVPTSFGLTEDFYPTYKTIAKEISKIFEVPFSEKEFEEPKSLHDVPGDWFKGPF